LAANISLGFLLGLLPQIMEFLGLMLDVRHVTLSAGNLAAGAMRYGFGIMQTWDFWFCVAGVFVIGVPNVGVSFALATWVALKSRRLGIATREELRAALLQRLWRQPLSIAFPTRKDRAADQPPNSQ